MKLEQKVLLFLTFKTVMRLKKLSVPPNFPHKVIADIAEIAFLEVMGHAPGKNGLNGAMKNYW